MSAPKIPEGEQRLAAPDPWENTVLRDIAVGRQVGEYVIRRRIGSGGMGIVYEAEHPQIGRRVAIKVLRPDLSASRDLLDEARVAATVHHRHIIDVFGFGELSGLGQYMVMDLLEGVSLDEEIRTKAPMTADAVIPILDDTAAALGAAHAKGVVHRDLKPGNLFLVNESGGTRYVKVLDFGLAKAFAGADSRERKTREGTTLGTPEYMAPEQAQAKPVDGRTDLYALGIIAFEMLTGQLPFTGDSPFQVAVSQVTVPAPTPRSYEGSIPVPLEMLVLKLLSKNPADRPPTAEAVRAELRRIRRTLSEDETQGVGRRPPRPESPAAANDASTPLDLAKVAPTPLVMPPVPPPTVPASMPVRRSPLLALGLSGGAVLLAALGYLALHSRAENAVVMPVPVPVSAPVPEEPSVAAAQPVAEAPATVAVPQAAQAPAAVKTATAKPKPRPAMPGALHVIAHGCWAEIFIDGVGKGRTPQPPMQLSAGAHQLKLMNDLCVPVIDERITVKPGETLKVEKDFTKN